MNESIAESEPETTYIVFDLEATCWDQGKHKPEAMETIEIGAVKVSCQECKVLSEFNRFVKPVQHPILSTFCKQLTSIRQEDVDTAELFPVVWEEFQEWIKQDSDICLASWGAFDPIQLKQDCVLHGLEYSFEDLHLNLKQMFGELHGGRKFGMKGALRLSGLTLEGAHHRGIDDARNIVKIFRWMMAQKQELGDECTTK